MALLTTTQAATILGVIPRRVRRLVQDGRIPAQKIGRDWMIDESELEKFERKPVGYQRKP